jgi:hypothetical protein
MEPGMELIIQSLLGRVYVFFWRVSFIKQPVDKIDSAVLPEKPS